MRIDHVAIAVEDLESAVKQYVDAFGITDIEYETVESEKVKVAILKMENASIELMASTGDGPIKKFLDTRGSGLHHVALETILMDRYQRWNHEILTVMVQEKKYSCI